MSINPSHFSNTTESIKVIEEIVVPYVEEQRRSLQLPNQAELIIMDVFRGQTTAEVLHILGAHNISLCKIPAKFGEWFAKQVENSLKRGRGNQHTISFTHYEATTYAMISRILQPHNICVRITYYNQLLESYSYVQCENG